MNAREEWFALWAIQERLLQSYRIMFGLIQTILLGVGAFQNEHAIFLIIILLALLILYCSKSICTARSKHISFIQWMLTTQGALSDSENALLVFKIFQSSGIYKHTLVTKTPEYRILMKSQTRFLIDTVIPVSYLTTWLFLYILNF